MENIQQTPPAIPARNRDVSFLEAPQSTPQPSVVEGVAVDLATVLANTLQGLLRNTAADIRIPLQTFSGLEQEDPRIFIARLREYFVKTRTENDEERILITAKHLRGDAARWFTPYSSYPLTFEEFELKLLTRFDGASARAVIKSKLYGDRQKDGESASLFIIKKRTLFNRVEPMATEDTMIAVILELLTPRLKPYLRGHTFTTLDDLARITEQIEVDLGETTPPPTPARRYLPPQSHSPQRNSNQSILNNQPNNSTSTPVPNERPAPRTLNEIVTRQNSARDNANANLPVRNSNDANSNDGPAPRPRPNRPNTPCRYCKAWHFHSECPENPFRQGNSAQAGRETTAPRAPPSSARPAPQRSNPSTQ